MLTVTKKLPYTSSKPKNFQARRGKIRFLRKIFFFFLSFNNIMPKIRTTRTKRAPEGFDEIEPTLEEFAKKMKEGKRQNRKTICKGKGEKGNQDILKLNELE